MEAQQALIGQTYELLQMSKRMGPIAAPIRAMTIPRRSYRTRFTWGPNQVASAVVYLNSPGNTQDPELEIRLNVTIAAHSITGYECTFSVKNDGSQYAGFGRWNGPFGNFTALGTLATGITPLANGDTISCQNVGGVITMYHNGTAINTATDTTYTAGSPGIGTDLDGSGGSGGGKNGLFGFSSFSAADGAGGIVPASSE